MAQEKISPSAEVAAPVEKGKSRMRLLLIACPNKTRYRFGKDACGATLSYRLLCKLSDNDCKQSTRPQKPGHPLSRDCRDEGRVGQDGGYYKHNAKPVGLAGKLGLHLAFSFSNWDLLPLQ